MITELEAYRLETFLYAQSYDAGRVEQQGEAWYDQICDMVDRKLLHIEMVLTDNDEDGGIAVLTTTDQGKQALAAFRDQVRRREAHYVQEALF